jgi:hypothetical protein
VVRFPPEDIIGTGMEEHAKNAIDFTSEHEEDGDAQPLPSLESLEAA